MPQPRSPFPEQRWQIAEPPGSAIAELTLATGLPPLVAKVLYNRGVTNTDRAARYLQPESETLPDPIEDFTDLTIAIDLILEAITTPHKIAICGDYDADGMTSTALLLRALRHLGATVDYAIPSRMTDGYGINQRIVDELAGAEVRLILTVDNGIAAYDAIAHARDLGLDVIVTDHHDLPEQLPPASAILNPKMIPAASPYRGMAGVGVAYLLAMTLAEACGRAHELELPMLELLTLGTIADLAPLTGVNRRWVQHGLQLLPQSQIPGIRALTQISGSESKKPLKPDAIGFRLGPRINAIGRIGNPQTVIDLLTTEDEGVALEKAMICEQTNKERQGLCSAIQAEAIAWCETSGVDWQRDRVLVIVQPDWHHGVIGIVASRLVERYGVPVFIGTYEGDDRAEIRGSARGIPEFNVFEGLCACDDLLKKYGGHPAAGGFSLSAENLTAFRDRLSQFAQGCLEPTHLKPLIEIDAEASFDEVNRDLFQALDQLHPCGIGNAYPVFWASDVTIVEQSPVGQDGLRLQLRQATPMGDRELRAIAWRWGEYCPLPSPVDLAFKLQENEWNGNTTIELEVVGIRRNAQTTAHTPTSYSNSSLTSPGNSGLRSRHFADHLTEADTSRSSSFPQTPSAPQVAAKSAKPAPANLENLAKPDQLPPPAKRLKHTCFRHNSRTYQCGLYSLNHTQELRIRNDRGQVLSVTKGSRTGLLGTNRDDAREVNVSEPHFFALVTAARQALELS